MKIHSVHPCSACGINRRKFIGCAACALASSLLPITTQASQSEKKLKIRIVFSLHAPKQPGPDWPNKGFDFEPHMERIRSVLADSCRNMEFVASMANGAEQAQKILEQDAAAPVDGYLVYQMNCWNRVVQTIAGSKRPVLYADFQYGGSGGFLVYNAGFLRSKTPNVGFVASSKMEDLVEAVKCFELLNRGGSAADFAAATTRVRLNRTAKSSPNQVRQDKLDLLTTEDCLKRLKESKILAVRSQESGPLPAIMGIPVVMIPFAEINAAWKSADRDEANAIVDRWEKESAKIEGVPRQTLDESAAMYLAEKAVMKKHGANAITMNCLGGFYGGHIQAYPCLGFHELLNEGLVGGCECDISSAAAMVAFGAMTQGRPGYISDPVIDTAKGQIIYAHCVASNRVFGPKGEASPFQILTHSEDRQGASVRAVLPLDCLTTTVELSNERKEILMHQGKAVANDPDDRACRTKLGVEPIGDLEKLFTAWDQWGWHRVTFYGDLKAPIEALAAQVGWTVVQEA